jgi:hypothetical protein
MTGHPYGIPHQTPYLDDSAREQERRRELDARRDQARHRQQAVNRMRLMSVKHAMHAWERRYHDPLAPHGLAFLFAHHDPAGGLRLTAATKLWLASARTAQLQRVLFDLNEAVTATAWPLDLREMFADRRDPEQADDAWYVGLGVTSLDTHTGTWSDACTRYTQYADVPAQIRVAMTDGTTIIGDRRGLAEYNALTLHSSRALDTSSIESAYPWARVSDQQLREDPVHAAVLHRMDQLNLTLWQADNARIDARSARPNPGHRGSWS